MVARPPKPGPNFTWNGMKWVRRSSARPQTEAKAKGLIGWSKGKPSTSYSGPKVGDYKGRTLNLTQKQLKSAGGGAAKAAGRTVDISKTQYVKGKGVLGPGGKPLNGRVDMGGGNFAVYVNGKRVRAPKK